jgi:hypothetical protein
VYGSSQSQTTSPASADPITVETSAESPLRESSCVDNCDATRLTNSACYGCVLATSNTYHRFIADPGRIDVS